MKDIQEYISIIKNKCTFAIIYYVNTKYICENGHEIISDGGVFFGSKESAELAMKFDIENEALPPGIESIERNIEHKIIEINI